MPAEVFAKLAVGNIDCHPEITLSLVDQMFQIDQGGAGDPVSDRDKYGDYVALVHGMAMTFQRAASEVESVNGLVNIVLRAVGMEEGSVLVFYRASGSIPRLEEAR